MRRRAPKKKLARNDTSSKAKIAAKKKKPRKTKTSRTRNGNTLTEAEYFQKIRNALRKAFRFWIPMVRALEDAKRPSQSTNKALKWEYQCAQCKKWLPRTSVEIDHTVPCGSLNTLEDIPSFILRLTPEDPKAFKVLCKSCHLEKTNAEKLARKILKIE